MAQGCLWVIDGTRRILSQAVLRFLCLAGFLPVPFLPGTGTVVCLTCDLRSVSTPERAVLSVWDLDRDLRHKVSTGAQMSEFFGFRSMSHCFCLFVC